MKKKIFINNGDIYGNWTVIDNHFKKITPLGKIKYLILSKCVCGKISLRETKAFLRPTQKGCFNCCKKGRIPWSKGKTGVFSAEARKKISIAQKGKRNSIKTEFKKGMTPWNKGKKMPQITGENHYLWRKDRDQTDLNKKRLYLKENIEWRDSVFKRDNYKCKICNKTGRLEAHHILQWRYYPELRFDVNNGITLCHACHPRKEAEEKRLIPIFQELVSVS